MSTALEKIKHCKNGDQKYSLQMHLLFSALQVLELIHKRPEKLGLSEGALRRCEELRNRLAHPERIEGVDFSKMHSFKDLINHIYCSQINAGFIRSFGRLLTPVLKNISVEIEKINSTFLAMSQVYGVLKQEELPVKTNKGGTNLSAFKKLIVRYDKLKTKINFIAHVLKVSYDMNLLVLLVSNASILKAIDSEKKSAISLIKTMKKSGVGAEMKS